jgi:hypothetical protein
MRKILKKERSFNNLKKESENILNLLLTMKKQYPNNMEFGGEVRKVLNKLNDD